MTTLDYTQFLRDEAGAMTNGELLEEMMRTCGDNSRDDERFFFMLDALMRQLPEGWVDTHVYPPVDTRSV